MFASLLSKLARALDGAGIPYMVIGGQAVLVHGRPRLTQDIDLTLGVDTSSLEGYSVRFAAAEDLILHKIFAGRARDLEDVESVVARKKMNLTGLT